jgi:hypothetical protein
VIHVCIPNYVGGISRKVEVQASWGKNVRLYPKITIANKKG